MDRKINYKCRTSQLQLIEGKIEGRRSPGRPRNAWTTDITNSTGAKYYQLKRAAEDRKKWHGQNIDFIHVYFCNPKQYHPPNANLDRYCQTVSIVTGGTGSHLADFVGHSIEIVFFMLTQSCYADKRIVNNL